MTLNSQISPWALALMLGTLSLFSTACGDDNHLGGGIPPDSSLTPDAGRDGGDTEIDGGQDEPDSGIVEDDGGSSEPDSGIVEDDGGQDEPDSGIIEPDGGQDEPDSGILEPDGGQDEPDSGIVEDDGGSSEPDGGQTEPDSGIVEPDGGQTEPDGGSADADGGQDEPDEQPSITISSFTATAETVRAEETLDVSWSIIGPTNAQVTLLRGSTQIYQGSDLSHNFTTPAWTEHADLVLNVTAGATTEQATLSIIVQPVIKSLALESYPIYGETGQLSYEVAGPSDTTVTLDGYSSVTMQTNVLSGTRQTDAFNGPTQISLQAASTRGGEVSRVLTVTPIYKFVSTETSTTVMNRSEQSFDLNASQATSVYIPAFPEYRGLAYRIEGTGFRTGPLKHIHVRKDETGSSTVTKAFRINEGSVDGTVFDLEANTAYVVSLDSLTDVTGFKLMTLPNVCPGGTDTMIGVCDEPAPNSNAHVVTECITWKDQNGQDLTGGTCQGGFMTVRRETVYPGRWSEYGIWNNTTVDATNNWRGYRNLFMSVRTNQAPSATQLYLYVNHGPTINLLPPFDYQIQCQARDSMGFLMQLDAFYESGNVVLHYYYSRKFSSMGLACVISGIPGFQGSRETRNRPSALFL